VFSGYAAEACVDKVQRARRYRGGNDSLHRGDPNTLAWSTCGQLMLRHGVEKTGLPGNDRQLVSVDISRQGKRYVKLGFNDVTERMRRVIKAQSDEEKLIERETTALYAGGIA
jgi:hypothetical protein